MFFKYIKMQRYPIFVYIMISFIFALTFKLYNLPIEAVWYGFAINVFISTIILVIGFLKFSYKHNKLEEIFHEVTDTLENLPVSKNVIETDYQKLIATLFEEKQNIENEAANKFSELTDYYTLWVHQIKTPISSMKLNLQSSISPENRELLEELQKIEQYVEMVLCYLRLDSDSTDYVIKEYSIDDIIKQAIRKQSSQFIRRKIKLDYDSLDIKVITDEKWLLFVIEQVISNSLKYTKTGSISITMKEPLLLCIRDTGIGIAAEDLPRIFEKGYTGYNGRKDKKASGIGLYLCKRICTKLGHNITACSELGKGTEIKIDLFSKAVIE